MAKFQNATDRQIQLVCRGTVSRDCSPQHRACCSFLAHDLQPFGHFEGHIAGERPNAVSNFHHWCKNLVWQLPPWCHQPWRYWQAHQLRTVNRLKGWMVFSMDFLWTPVWRWFDEDCCPPTSLWSFATWCHQVYLWSRIHCFEKEDCSAEREKSRNEFAKLHFHSTSTPSTKCSDSRWGWDACCCWRWKWCTGPDITSEGIDVDDVCGSVDEIHACEEHRLVRDEHTLESEKATEEPFFPENLQLSKSDDVLVENVVPAEIQAPVYNMSPESNAAVVNNLVPDETFGSKNFKMPVESYVRASHAVRFWVAAAMMASLPTVATGAELLPSVIQQPFCDVMTEQRLPWDVTIGMPIKMLAMLLFSLLSVLALGMTVWCGPTEAVGIRIQVVEERARALRFSQDLEQSNYEREQHRGYWSDTFDENVTLQMELDKSSTSRSKKLAQQIPEDRWESCLQCLFQHSCDPLQKPPEHLNYLWWRLSTVLPSTWGQSGLHAHDQQLRAGMIQFLFTAFAPVLIALHALMSTLSIWAFAF